MARMTIRDIARLAGVSVTTVSRALNNAPEINSQTRERVLQVCREQGYRSNLLARSLVSSRTRVLGVILPELSGPFHASIVLHLERYAQEQDYQIMLCCGRVGGSETAALFDFLVSHRVDGILLVSASSAAPDLLRRHARGTPSVLLGDVSPTATLQRINAVSTDNYVGGAMAAGYLSRLGHRRVLYLGPRRDSVTHVLRHQGFLTIARERGMEVETVFNPGAVSSAPNGYRLARQAGHTLVEPVPSLVSLVSRDPDCKKMMGLALKNVTLTLLEDGKAIFDEQGEMLFTHFGISGPLTLSASSHLGDMKKHRYIAEIDLKPALSEEQLYDRITRDFALLANHAAQGALVKLLPSSMQPVMVARWGIDPATKANQITREQKRELVQLVKHWQVSIDARGDLAHAVITSGGVSVREVDPKTMQSKKALGLYFAGEVLDVDAYTGGYNLQIAFCTAQSFANNL